MERLLLDRFPDFDSTWPKEAMLAWFGCFSAICAAVQRTQQAALDRAATETALCITVLARNPWAVAALRPPAPPAFRCGKARRVAALLRLGMSSAREIAAEVRCSRQLVYLVRSWREHGQPDHRPRERRRASAAMLRP
jgi:hypothetical protein